MEHDANQTHRGTDNQRHGDGQDQQQLGSRHRIRPGTAMPPTVFVADIGGGPLFLQGWWDSPSGGQGEAL
ncbi:MAG: hypothetical protein ACRDRR_07275 [Pseudonocardiaceae bacterium]